MNKRFFTHIFILLITLFLSGIEQLNAQTSSKEMSLKKKLEEAEYFFLHDNYHLALPILQELYAKDSNSVDINFKIGICIYLTKRNKTTARKYFEFAKNDYIDSYFYLGSIYHQLILFDKAIAAYQYYKLNGEKKEYSKEETEQQINKCLTAKELVRFPIRVTIKNMGNTVNSIYPDYVPLITSDESTMFFTSRREGSTGNQKDPYGDYFEDIYETHKNDTVWTKPKNLGSPVNTSNHDACVSISPDGKKMYIYRAEKDLATGNIYYTEYNDTVWSDPIKANTEINSIEGLVTSGTISPDDNIFYFSSDRTGGFGGKDIYRVVKFPNGNLSKAMNLGPTINTQYDEDAPFIHPDGQTLYFSSKGHKNMGGFDVFRSVLNDDGIWSTPENLGYPINTVANDIYFVTTADKMKGYYSCDKEGNGNTDIFEIDMPENPSNYKLLKGVIISNDNIPETVKATITITLIDNVTNTLLGVYRTNKETGAYLLIVEPRKKYKMIVEASDFENTVEVLEIPESSKQVIIKDIKINRTRR